MGFQFNRKFFLLLIIIVGFSVPFIPILTILEMFFLLIPFGIIMLGTLIYLLISVFNKNINKRKAIFVFSILPVFLLSQYLSGITVDKIQKYRSMQLINELKTFKNKNGKLPYHVNTPIGIEYIKMNDQRNFEITYEKGFMATEKYYSQNNKWKSIGFRD